MNNPDLLKTEAAMGLDASTTGWAMVVRLVSTSGLNNGVEVFADGVIGALFGLIVGVMAGELFNLPERQRLYLVAFGGCTGAVVGLISSLR